MAIFSNIPKTWKIVPKKNLGKKSLTIKTKRGKIFLSL